MEDKNNDKDEVDKGQTEAVENGDRVTAASRARAGLLHRHPSGIRLPSCPSRICLEAEEREVTVSTPELEVAPEEEVKVKDCRRFFRPCRWIN